MLPGEGTKVAYSVIRKAVPFLEEDRVMYEDIGKINILITSGELLKRYVENAICELEC